MTWLLLATAAWGQTHFTVDDDGPADFSSLQTAVNSVPDDAVLLIQPGSYGNVLVGHPVVLLGQPNGSDRPKVGELSVSGADHVDVVSLDASFLQLSSLPHRSRVEDVNTQYGAIFKDVRELFVARCTFDHSAAFQPYQGAAGAAVSASVGQPTARAQFVGCVLRGGKGTPFDLDSGAGGPGLSVLRAQVVLSGCSVFGGLGQDGPWGSGYPGAGVSCALGSLDIRGLSTDVIAGASQILGGLHAQGMAIGAFPGDTVTYSNVTTVGAVSATVVPLGPQPWAVWSLPPGGAQYSVHGPAGDAVLWVLASQTAFDESTTPLYGLPLTFDLGSVILSGGLLLQGPDVPVSVSFALPTNPAFLGVPVAAQAASVSAVDGSIRITNGDDVVLRF